MQAVANHLKALGPDARRARRLLATLLDSGATTIDAVVAQSGAPRREVEHLIKLMGEDARRDGHRIEVVGGDYDALALRPAPPRALPVAEMERVLAGRPAADRQLDHVQATAETVLKRVAWLDDEFELAQSRVLMLGDHDATSLAFGVLGVVPAALAVVDIDHALLEFLDEIPHLHFADLRLGLPPTLHARFDIVVTDPPYSPEGIGLFAARAVEAIERHDNGRIVLAYGFPPHQPALGLKVQTALSDLSLVYEAVLPGFNHYEGAQAIGSRSAQYVLRLTRRSKKVAARQAERTAIYSHGRQSIESAAQPPQLPGAVAITDLGARREEPVTVNLAPYHGYSLVHAALAARAPAVDLLVPNETDGVRSQAEQERTRRILGDVSFERSYQGTPYTLVRVRGRLPEPNDGPLHRLQPLAAASAVAEPAAKEQQKNDDDQQDREHRVAPFESGG